MENEKVVYVYDADSGIRVFSTEEKARMHALKEYTTWLLNEVENYLDHIDNKSPEFKKNLRTIIANAKQDFKNFFENEDRCSSYFEDFCYIYPATLE